MAHGLAAHGLAAHGLAGLGYCSGASTSTGQGRVVDYAPRDASKRSQSAQQSELLRGPGAAIPSFPSR